MNIQPKATQSFDFNNKCNACCKVFTPTENIAWTRARVFVSGISRVCPHSFHEECLNARAVEPVITCPRCYLEISQGSLPTPE